LENKQGKAVTALTRRQRAIYQYLRARDSEQPPTLGEICRDLGLRSRGSLHKHIQALARAGLVEPMEGKHRGVRLRSIQEHEDHGLPFLGKIAAGSPFEPFEIPDTLEVPQFLSGTGSCYVLQVKGDSMVDEGILDGDLVVIEQTDHAPNNTIVVALIEGHETTLKRIEQRPGKVILYSANPDLEPMAYSPDQVQIQGVLVGQMRSYR